MVNTLDSESSDQSSSPRWDCTTCLSPSPFCLFIPTLVSLLPCALRPRVTPWWP
ncbi:unnamed protein product [Gulo gulo]|uniref:Uncharacterized protein n=1 Tax=Gulo gulo TaxID=48420 RepID=A0A9X9LNM3_GULGU|nr:unnamed protein product [Gulo gulo]